MQDFRPLTESYWVEPGKILAGEHPGHWDDASARRRLAGLLDAGVRSFVDLSAPGDRVRPYRSILDKLCRDRGIVADYLHVPLVMHAEPECPGEVREILEAIHAHVARGVRVYVHCSDGVDRTGMVVGCWLVERGFDPEAALDELARRFGAMSKARIHRSTPSRAIHVEWVLNWVPSLGIKLEHSRAS
jgi:hypothetical protein